MMRLNETQRLLGPILLTSFGLVCERNLFHSIFKTSDAPLNVITIFRVVDNCDYMFNQFQFWNDFKLYFELFSNGNAVNLLSFLLLETQVG